MTEYLYFWQVEAQLCAFNSILTRPHWNGDKVEPAAPMERRVSLFDRGIKNENEERLLQLSHPSHTVTHRQDERLEHKTPEAADARQRFWPWARGSCFLLSWERFMSHFQEEGSCWIMGDVSQQKRLLSPEVLTQKQL